MKFLGPLASIVVLLADCCSLNVIKNPVCFSSESKKFHSYLGNVTKRFLIKCSSAKTCNVDTSACEMMGQFPY